MQIYQDGEQELYIPVKTALGWIALCLNDQGTYGGVQPTKEDCVDGLKPTGWVINKRDSKPWQGHMNFG